MEHMPSLDKQAEAARKLLKEEYQRRKFQPRSLPLERDTAVLWGVYRGWSDSQIGRHFYIHRNTVLRARRRFAESPPTIFRIPILHQGVSGTRQMWRCEVCDARMRGSKREARTHVARHFVVRDDILYGGIMDEG